MVTLIHTTDLHNRLNGRAAQRLRDVVDAYPGAVLLDSGDAVRAGNAFFHPLGEPVLERMTQLGYAAMALGNREFHVFPSWMRRKLQQAGFPIIASNVEPKSGTRTPFVRSLTVDASGVRVGILAVVTPMVREGTLMDRICGFRFLDPVGCVRDVAGELRQGTDLVVALTHCSHEVSAQVASLPEVDVTLAGHSHDTEADTTPSAVIVHSGSHARAASVVTWDRPTLTWDVRSRPLTP